MAKTKAVTKADGPKAKRGGLIKGNRADVSKTIKDEVGALTTQRVDGLAVTYATGFAQAKVLMANALQQLSVLPALQDITPMELAELHDYVNTNLTGEKSAAAEVGKIVRARAMERVQALGTPTETGSIKWEFTKPDGQTYVKEARIQKSGLDGTQVEVALRARNLKLERYMDAVTLYKLKPTTEQLLLDDKVFTPDELTALKYKPSYALQKTRLAKDGGES